MVVGVGIEGDSTAVTDETLSEHEREVRPRFVLAGRPASEGDSELPL